MFVGFYPEMENNSNFQVFIGINSEATENASIF